MKAVGTVYVRKGLIQGKRLGFLHTEFGVFTEGSIRRMARDAERAKRQVRRVH